MKTIEAFISNTDRLNMTSNFDNMLIIVVKDTLKAFDDFKNKQKVYEVMLSDM